MSFLCESNSQYNIINTSSKDNFYFKIPSISKNNNNIKPLNKNKANYFHFKLLSEKNDKYTNNILFSKRELAFNKNLEKNKTSFKYNKYTSFYSIIKTKNNKSRIRNNSSNKMNILRKNNSSDSPLYLTEYIYKNNISNKNNNSIAYYKNLNKSRFYETDKSNINNTNLDNTNFSSKKSNSLFNNYISFCRGIISKDKSSFYSQLNIRKNKKINLKLNNPSYVLKLFEADVMKENNNKKKIEFKYKQLYRKNNYLNNYRVKESSKMKYIDSFRDYLKEKKSLSGLVEKKNALEEKINNEFNEIKNKENSLKQYYEDFNEIFFVKFNQYFKRILNQIEKERIKNDNYIKYISSLKKEINSLKSEMNKSNINIEYLNKFALLNAKIKLKKLSLPQYYEYIFDNNISKLKKFNLSEEDIKNIKKYKTNINFNEIISLLNKYENNDLDLIKNNNYLKEDIKILNKQKENILEDFCGKDNYMIEKINEKIMEITKIKTKYQQLVDDKNLLINYIQKNMISTTERISSNRIRKSIVSINYNKLYMKIINILNNLSEYIKHKFTIKIPKAKEGIQAMMLYNLAKIEELIDILLNKVNKFKHENPNNKTLIKTMLEESRKIRKDSESRKKRDLSLKIMKKRIDEKNKKIITKTRVNVYSYNMLSKHKKHHKPKKVIKIETIYDYLNP